MEAIAAVAEYQNLKRQLSIMKQKGKYGRQETNLDNFPSMRAPRIAQPPRPIPMPVKHPNLAIHRPRRAPVAVSVERNRLHQIPMAVL